MVSIGSTDPIGQFLQHVLPSNFVQLLTLILGLAVAWLLAAISFYLVWRVIFRSPWDKTLRNHTYDHTEAMRMRLAEKAKSHTEHRERYLNTYTACYVCHKFEKRRLMQRVQVGLRTLFIPKYCHTKCVKKAHLFHT